jgi:hypothetical protein
MALFRTGEIVTTNGITREMVLDHRFLEAVRTCLDRHCRGDWGDVGDDGRQMNNDALEAERNGEPTDRLFSLYTIGDREIYIITEWDRSATTILFPEEY